MIILNDFYSRKRRRLMKNEASSHKRDVLAKTYHLSKSGKSSDALFRIW